MTAHLRIATVVTAAILATGAIGLALWASSTSAFADQGPSVDGHHGRMMAADEDHPAWMHRGDEQMTRRHARMHADGEPRHDRRHDRMHDRDQEMQRHMDGTGPQGMGPGSGRGMERGMGPYADDPPCQRAIDDVKER